MRFVGHCKGVIGQCVRAVYVFPRRLWGPAKCHVTLNCIHIAAVYQMRQMTKLRSTPRGVRSAHAWS